MRVRASSDEFVRVRTNSDEFGRVRTNSDEFVRVRTSSDEFGPGMAGDVNDTLIHIPAGMLLDSPLTLPYRKWGEPPTITDKIRLKRWI